MQIIATILISAVMTITSLFGAYKFIPLSWIESTPKLGATITTIAGTDTLSSSRTTINNNFTALNNGKIENSTTTLPLITSLANLATIGTITTGTWNATTLTVSKGGTGSTTLAGFHILMGSSTNAVDIVGGLGTSGQFLTSQGVGLPPQWTTASVDQGIAYNWTGNHNFTGTTRIKTLHASSTQVINGVSLSYPSNQGASSTMLMNDGSGNMTWNAESWDFLGEVILASAASSISITSLPARTELKVYLYSTGITTDDNILMRFNNDSGTNYGYDFSLDNAVPTKANSAAQIVLSGAATTSASMHTIEIQNIANLKKFVTIQGTFASSTAAHYSTAPFEAHGLWVNTTDAINRIDFLVTNFAAGTRMRVYGSKQ